MLECLEEGPLPGKPNVEWNGFRVFTYLKNRHVIVEEGAFSPALRQSLNAKLSPAGEALPSIRTIQTISQWADKDHS